MPEAPELRYRIVCFELEGDTETVILDTTARAFIAVTGTLDDRGTMRGEGTHAGPRPLLMRIVLLIGEGEYLAS